MDNNAIQIQEADTPAPRIEPWKLKLYIISGVGGVALGLLSAFMLIKNAERSGHEPSVSAREGLQLALLLFGTVRSVANLWEN
jgi:hypothetical protein